MVPLRPEFADETVSNPGRGHRARTSSGRTVPIRTTYADLATAWRLEAVVEDGRLFSATTGGPLRTTGGYAGVAGWDTGRALDRHLYVVDTTGQWLVGDATTLSPDAVAYREGRQGLEQIRVWHHSSFVAGGPVVCAGDLATDRDGRLLRISNWSGHYKPALEALVEALRLLGAAGLDLSAVDAEVVRAGGRVVIVNAGALSASGALDGLVDRTVEVRRADAIGAVTRWLRARWTPGAAARLDRWVAAGLRAGDPTAFDPADPVHWNFLVRWAIEGREPTG